MTSIQIFINSKCVCLIHLYQHHTCLHRSSGFYVVIMVYHPKIFCQPWLYGNPIPLGSGVELMYIATCSNCIWMMYPKRYLLNEYLHTRCVKLTYFSIPDGYYIYQEADNISKGQKTRLLSPVLRSTPAQICVQFRYYMYGADNSNTLSVLAKRPDVEEMLWEKIGIQSPSWLGASVTVSKPTEQSVEVSTKCYKGMGSQHAIDLETDKPLF